MKEKYNYSGVITFKIKITDKSGCNVTDIKLSEDFGMNSHSILSNINGIMEKVDLSNDLFNAFPPDEEDIKKTKRPLLYFEEEDCYHFIYKDRGTVKEFKVISILITGDKSTEEVIEIFNCLTKKFKKYKYKMEIQNKEFLQGHLVINGEREETNYLLRYYQQIAYEKKNIKNIFKKKTNIFTIICFAFISSLILFIHVNANNEVLGITKEELLLFLYPFLFSTITPLIKTFVDSNDNLKIKNLKVYEKGRRSLSDEEIEINNQIENLEQDDDLIVSNNTDRGETYGK